MFDKRIHEEQRERGARSFGFGWIAAGLALAALVGLGVAIGMRIRRPDLPVLLDEIEEAAQSGLAGVARAGLGDARDELARFRRRLLRMDRRLQRELDASGFSARPDDVRGRAARTDEELARLIDRVRTWERRIREADEPDPAERWTRICVEALNERVRWPLTGVVRRPLPPMRPYRWWWQFRDGFVRGVGWPAFAVLNAAQRSPPGMGVFRRAVFPYSRHVVFGVFQLLGFGVGAIGIGYGFCWIGMRFNLAWASYLGLVYFVYMLVFAVCVAAGMMGVMP